MRSKLRMISSDFKIQNVNLAYFSRNFECGEKFGWYRVNSKFKIRIWLTFRDILDALKMRLISSDLKNQNKNFSYISRNFGRVEKWGWYPVISKFKIWIRLIFWEILDASKIEVDLQWFQNSKSEFGSYFEKFWMHSKRGWYPVN